MAIVPSRKRQTSFTKHSVDNPSIPQRGTDIDLEFDNTNRAINKIIEVVSKTIQDDERLQPEIVFLRNLAPEVFDFFLNGGDYVIPDPENPGTPVTPGGGGNSNIGILRFIQALDTPSSYQNQGGKFLQVKQTEDGIQFSTLTFPELKLQNATDVPDFDGNALRLFRVNTTEDAVELISFPIDPSGKYARLDIANDYEMKLQENFSVGRHNERFVDLGTQSGNVDIDITRGNIFKVILAGTTIFQITTQAPLERIYSFMLRITSPAETQINIAGADWGWRTRYEFDQAEGQMNTIIEQTPAPTLPAGSDLLFSVFVWPDGKIHCRG